MINMAVETDYYTAMHFPNITKKASATDSNTDLKMPLRQIVSYSPNLFLYRVILLSM